MGLENPLHLAIIVLVVILLFGARRLPEMGRSLGSGIKEFKGSLTAAQPTNTVTDAQPVAPETSRV